MDFLLDDGPSEIVDGSFIPAAMVVLGIISLGVCIFARYHRNVVGTVVIFIVLAGGALVLSDLVGSGAVITNVENPPFEGMTEVTLWLQGLFPLEILHGNITGGAGRLVATAGLIIAFLGAAIMQYHNPNRAAGPQ